MPTALVHHEQLAVALAVDRVLVDVDGEILLRGESRGEGQAREVAAGKRTVIFNASPCARRVRYTDGTVNHWEKMERPGVLLIDGHVAYFTLAALDVPKEQELGDDIHGSKVVVIPFDGAALDRDLEKVIQMTPPKK
jgi:hypothetical protein